MEFNTEDIDHLRRHVARVDELAEKMRAAEAAGDETNAVGAGMAFECEMDWTAPACVDFARRILDAFEAMERNGWHLNQGRTWRHDQDVYESPGIAYWKVVAYPKGAAVGHEIARAATPLAALLTATEKHDGH